MACSMTTETLKLHMNGFKSLIIILADLFSLWHISFNAKTLTLKSNYHTHHISLSFVMIQVPSHVACFLFYFFLSPSPLLTDHQETFSLWSGFIIALGFDGAHGQMSPVFCVCLTDEQQCCEPHGSQQHLDGSERIRKTHQFHTRAAKHDVSTALDL